MSDLGDGYNEALEFKFQDRPDHAPIRFVKLDNGHTQWIRPSERHCVCGKMWTECYEGDNK